MGYGIDSLEKRLKDNSKNYNLAHLFQLNDLYEYMKLVGKITETELLLTGRDGEKVVSAGNFANFAMDAEKESSRKIRVEGRTVGYLYVIYSSINSEKREVLERFFDRMVQQLAVQGELRYQQAETVIYVDELESKLEKERYLVKHGEKEDVLTGTMNSTYFSGRLQIIERSEVIPVAVVVGNINDWKYVNDKYGEEKSDQLIEIIAKIIKEEAKPDYVIGRVEGDVFHILIPMSEKEEVEEFCRRVQEKCNAYEDEKLAPSIAFGYVMKTNVEEKLTELFSDAEYEMFQNKIEIKNASGYKERLEKEKK